jgi:DNA polymerase-4
VQGISAPLKQSSLAARTIILKLKTADFSPSHVLLPSRRRDQLAKILFHTATTRLAGEADGRTRFQLIGVGARAFLGDIAADPPTLFDRELGRARRLEHPMIN